MAKIKQKDFEEAFESLRGWIRESVNSFDSTEEEKQARIKRSETDKKYFAEQYLPHYCEDGFATTKIPEYGKDMHTDMLELADTMNTPVVIAGYRECAKSTCISIIDELHKTVFRKNKFTIFISDSQEVAASEYVMPLLAELTENQRLIGDFGEFRTNHFSYFDAILKSGKRILALGPKMGGKGRRLKNWRPDRAIVEDFENRNSSRKSAIIKRRLKWILQDLKRGLNSKNWQLIYIGNYYSKKTIIHKLLKDDEHDHFIRRIYKAIIEVKGKEISTWSSRFPISKLRIDRDENPVEFKTEMMQQPEDDESPFKEEWIRYYDDEDIDYLHLESFMTSLPVVTYKDPSALKGEESCYKAIIALAVDIHTMIFYVRKAWIKRTSVLQASQAHFDISEEFNSCIDAVESNGFQVALKEVYELIEVRRKRRLNLKLINNRLPKEVRISSLSSLIERGYIRFKRDQRLLIEQLLEFPDGDFVDGPDALEGAYNTARTFLLKIKNKVKARAL